MLYREIFNVSHTFGDRTSSCDNFGLSEDTNP